jgi:hypothetical protein
MNATEGIHENTEEDINGLIFLTLDKFNQLILQSYCLMSPTNYLSY